MAGTNPPPPNGQGAAKPPLRRPKVNPMVMRKNGARITPKISGPVTLLPPGPGPAKTSSFTQKDNLDEALEPPGPFRDIPLVVTKQDVLDGLRFHAMRMHGEGLIDITDADKWIPPVRLHRRDPRAVQIQEDRPAPEPVIKTATAEEDKERERVDAIKAERKRVREENQAQIAPTQKQQQQPVKTLHFNKKFEQVFLAADTPAAKAKAQLKYEELLPWHLEDEGAANVFKGTYVSELSKRNALAVFESGATAGSNQIRLVMLDRWYRFQERTKFKPLGFEEAEAQLSRSYKNPKWMEEADKRDKESAEHEKNAQSLSRVIKVKGGGQNKQNMGSIDDVDFDMNEDFADDDEGAGLLGHDEDEVKDAEERIRKGQYAFHSLGVKDEDEEEVKLTKEEEDLRKLEKLTRKTLAKKENNVNYLFSDDDSDPYASSSEEETDTEKTPEDDAAAKAKGKETAEATPESQAPTVPTSTSSSGPAKKNATNLKRPGSPTISESSDLESIRKRVKKNPKASKLKASASAGTDAGESAAKPSTTRKIKLSGSAKSPNATPIASTPASGNGSDVEDSEDFFSDELVIVTLEKIKEAIPDDGKGISLKRLLTRFRRMDKSTAEFVGLLKKVSHFDKATRRIYPLNPRVKRS